MEGIHPLLDRFKSSREEIDPVLRNIDAKLLQKMNDDKESSRAGKIIRIRDAVH